MEGDVPWCRTLRHSVPADEFEGREYLLVCSTRLSATVRLDTQPCLRTLLFPSNEEALVDGEAICFDGKLETVYDLDVSAVLRSEEGAKD